MHNWCNKTFTVTLTYDAVELLFLQKEYDVHEYLAYDIRNKLFSDVFPQMGGLAKIFPEFDEKQIAYLEEQGPSFLDHYLYYELSDIKCTNIDPETQKLTYQISVEVQQYYLTKRLNKDLGRA